MPALAASHATTAITPEGHGPEGATAGATPSATPGAAADHDLTLRVPVDALTRFAGLVGLATAVLAAAGVASSAAYLSAWGIPAPLIRLDPVTAALRADSVTFQVLVLSGMIYLFSRLERGTRHSRRRRAVYAGALALVLVLGITALATRQWGGVFTDLGVLAVVGAHHRFRLSQRGVLVAFVIVAILSSYASGVQFGMLYRDYPELQTPITLTAKAPIGGLGGGVEDRGGFRYEGLYLVFRDGEAVYVSRPGAGSRVWIVQAPSVVSLGVGAGTGE